MGDANFRAKVVKAAKKAEEKGLCQYKSGNFSMIDRDNGVVYITPSGISRDELTSAMIAKIDIDGNVLEGDFAPSIEVAMHLSAYRARPEA
ncbi:MAG: class II aldolase/adducin family protein, partial [Bacillota bacterium]|nr:class II aldolase/adducin family protein [Bacillota bacterium]